MSFLRCTVLSLCCGVFTPGQQRRAIGNLMISDDNEFEKRCAFRKWPMTNDGIFQRHNILLQRQITTGSYWDDNMYNSKIIKINSGNNHREKRSFTSVLHNTLQTSIGVG